MSGERRWPVGRWPVRGWILLWAWSVRSRRNFIISAALHWTVPMSVLFCGVFYANRSLTVISAIGIVVCTLLGGFGFAAVYCAYLTEKYGVLFKSEQKGTFIED